MFNLDKLASTTVPYKVYCSTGDHTVSRQQNQIQFADCYNNVQGKISAQVDDDHFVYTESPQRIFMIFAGRTVVAIDKQTGSSVVHQLDPTRIGQCTTKIWALEEDLVFGTRSMGRSQIVRYNPLLQKRVCQSSSWNLDSITDFQCNGKYAYMTLNKSMIVKTDMSTGMTLFNRFESGSIGKNLCLYQNGIVYPLNGVITVCVHPEAQRQPCPKQVESTEHVQGNDLFLVCKDSLCCYNMSSKELRWSTPNDSIIRQTILTQAMRDGQLLEILIVRLDDAISFVNAATGQIVRNEKCTKNVGMKLTGNNLVVHRESSVSTVFQGAADVV